MHVILMVRVVMSLLIAVYKVAKMCILLGEKLLPECSHTT